MVTHERWLRYGNRTEAVESTQAVDTELTNYKIHGGNNISATRFFCGFCAGPHTGKTGKGASNDVADQDPAVSSKVSSYRNPGWR